jgi:integrase
MPRRQRGSLRKERRSAGETWVLRYFVTKTDGSRVENTRAIGLVRDLTSKSAAWAEVDRQHLQTQINQPDFKGRVTFGDLATHYEEHELGDQAEAAKPKAYTTVIRSKGILKNCLIPRWGKEVAVSIAPLEIEKWLRALRREKGLAYPTLHKVRQVMSLVYKHSQRWGLIPRNEDSSPLRFVRCQTTSDYESMTIAPEQALAVTRELPELEKTLVLLTTATGLRISEALGLRWDDVDFAGKQIHIRRSWTAGEFGKPKTKASKAVVPMHEILAGFMQTWREQTPYAKDTDWVFPSFKLDGRQPRLSGMIVTDYLRPAAAKAGVLSSKMKIRNGKRTMVITDDRTFGFHALRHSLATFLVAKDVDPKTVQAVLRHANVTTTLQLYAKSVDGKRLEAQRQVLAAMLQPTSGVSGRVN